MLGIPFFKGTIYGSNSSRALWGGAAGGRGTTRKLPHAVVVDRQRHNHGRRTNFGCVLSCSLIVVVGMYLVVIFSFHSLSPSASIGGSSRTVTSNLDIPQRPGEDGQLTKQKKSNQKKKRDQNGYCDFRSYPDHRYYGIPKFHRKANSNQHGHHLPDFLNTEYIYGKLPQMIQPKTLTSQKLCVDQSEWYLPEIISGDTAGKQQTKLPFADGTNPSILKIKDNPRINESIRTLFMNGNGNRNDENNTPMYLATVCMTNSQCSWKDTEQQIIDYRLSTQDEPSTVRTVLLVLNSNFETLMEATIMTEIDAPFGRRIKSPQQVAIGATRTYKKLFFALDDARLFTYKGAVWVSYREGKGFGYDKQVLNKVHFNLLNNDSKKDSSDTMLEVTLKASETETLCCGRNMALIDNVYTNELQALTWVDPITVVDVEITKQDVLTGRRLTEARGGNKKQKKKRDEKKKSHFHGTNGFMLYLPRTDEYLGIGHFHRPPDREENEYARFGHHYTHAFFTIPATPPYHLKRLSPEIVLPSHAKSDDAEIIQFWSGLELHDDDTIVMAYGVNDCEGAATYLDLSTVESLLRMVPSGKEVVDLMTPLAS